MRHRTDGPDGVCIRRLRGRLLLSELYNKLMGMIEGAPAANHSILTARCEIRGWSLRQKEGFVTVSGDSLDANRDNTKPAEFTCT